MLTDYIELVDWTGQIVRDDKFGFINPNLPPILKRLNFEKDAWHTLTTQFENQFKQWVGAELLVKQTYKAKKYQRIPSTARHKALFG